MSDWLETFATFLANFRYADLPDSTVDQARYVLLDTIGAIACGAQEPEMAAANARLGAVPGPATLIGAGRATTPSAAALLNGMAGTFLEMDEGNRFARGHPSIHTFGAAWALGEARDVSGHAFLEAFVLGYEAAARLGMAAPLKPPLHPHGTWGGLGAAVAAGKLYGFDAAQMRDLVNVFSSLTLASSKRTMLEGGLVRNAYAGVSNQMGLMAAELVLCGFDGERDGLRSVFGNIVAQRFEPEVLTAALGDVWQIERNYFKRHSCCRYNHGALDALEKLLVAHGPLGIGAIERIDVQSYRDAAEMDDQSPRNTLAAKFSVPFAIASRLVTGSSDVGSFTWDAVRNPAIQALAKRVFITEDPALTAMLPQFRPARVQLRCVDGKVLEASTDSNRGDDQDPYSREELREKFRALAGRAWSADVIAQTERDILRLQDIARIADISTRWSAEA